MSLRTSPQTGVAILWIFRAVFDGLSLYLGDCNVADAPGNDSVSLCKQQYVCLLYILGAQKAIGCGKYFIIFSFSLAFGGKML